MKKLIQICSLLTLLVAFSVVSINAQSNFGSEVEIPFAFQVGENSYEAGSYIVKVNKLTPSTAKLSIEDPETGKIQNILMGVTGESAGSEIKLVFDNYEGRRHLSKVRTTETTFAIAGLKGYKDAAARKSAGSAKGTGEASLF
jgi:hypothetical protein